MKRRQTNENQLEVIRDASVIRDRLGLLEALVSAGLGSSQVLLEVSSVERLQREQSE